MATPAGRERRRAERNTVLKRAQLLAGHTLFDCLITDSSETGVRIRTPSPVPLPEKLVLRLSGDLTIAAVRRWSRGSDLGLEFTGEDLTRAASNGARAWMIHALLAEGRFEEAVRELRAAHCFGDTSLRRALAGAEATRAQLLDALRRFAAAQETAH